MYTGQDGPRLMLTDPELAPFVQHFSPLLDHFHKGSKFQDRRFCASIFNYKPIKLFFILFVLF